MIFIDFGLVFYFSLGWSARSPTPTPPTIPGPLGLLFYDAKNSSVRPAWLWRVLPGRSWSFRSSRIMEIIDFHVIKSTPEGGGMVGHLAKSRYKLQNARSRSSRGVGRSPAARVASRDAMQVDRTCVTLRYGP